VNRQRVAGLRKSLNDHRVPAFVELPGVTLETGLMVRRGHQLDVEHSPARGVAATQIGICENNALLPHAASLSSSRHTPTISNGPNARAAAFMAG
jgi:hypothetical protein